MMDAFTIVLLAVLAVVILVPFVKGICERGSERRKLDSRSQ